MEDNQKEVIALQKSIARLEKRRNKIQVQINENWNELRTICTHPRKTIKNTRIEGGYLNRSESKDTTYCLDCGVKLAEEVTYGGFA